MAAGNTYVALATTTLGSNTNTVTFSSISSAYTDLVVVMSSKLVTGGTTCRIQVNADTATNYSQTNLAGNGTSAGSSRNTTQAYIRIGEVYAGLSTSQSTVLVNLQNYSNTTTNKTILIRSSDSVGEVSAIVGLWRSTSAINRIDLIAGASDNWASGSTFSIYGIASA